MFGQQRKPAVNRKVALVELGKSALIFLGVVAGTPPLNFRSPQPGPQQPQQQLCACDLS
jgi:hypothetical protein